MFEPLFLTDMLLALAAIIAAVVTGGLAGRLARRPAGLRRLRFALYGTATLVVLRLAVAVLILTGGLALADSRLIVQVPLAVLPIAWALMAVRRHDPVMAAHAAAGGVLLSGVWLFIPFDPVIQLIVSVPAVGLSALVGRWRTGGSRLARLPWAAVVYLLAPAVVLGLSYQANVAAAHAGGHHGGSMDWGSGAMPHHAAQARSVDQLTGPRDKTPDARFTLTAARGKVRLGSGREIDALTFNGKAPGPELRVRLGSLVEVTLINTDVEEGVTLHWHGVDVPNAEDGVPGVTQEAVLPGGRHVYRFVPDRPGTFWYHTHRDAAETVERGLFGALIVENPQQAAHQGVEKTVFTHLWPRAEEAIAAFGTADRPSNEAVAAGEPVLLRLINSSEEPHRIHVGGTAYTVTAIDGNPIQGATPLTAGTDLLLAAGGRYDLAFTMPRSTVTLSIDVNEIPNTAALAFSPDGTAPPDTLGMGPLFDPLTYGTAAPAGEDRYDRAFDLRLDDGFGFAMGRFNYVSSSINGRLYPAVPMLMVSAGDRVKVRIANRSLIDHPMHLHGHRIRVLSRNGVPATGSPWWTDTLNVAPGEVFEVAFTAGNPGIWMDHCHNFKHGSEGMVMHLGYAGVTTPYTEDRIPE
ncbi:FtsP/CotA-like multicopper oxidase with cupredoxin domain [Nonomuraea polychroma]|uniref:FtsP/CotA-like multicopper oxidase with cupredoxin domain n=1 Tax=Nonomuraea polychroma TaxID=46176 RepID=A0A438LZM3_9ACTN|nr:multicopper oxidase family protein [Nonomuraea polychroma]RVX38807.1 FtsP/CotA-like multicopper oxidase with cupredoxin domain [Nonomuraea polychroma]